MVMMPSSMRSLLLGATNMAGITKSTGGFRPNQKEQPMFRYLCSAAILIGTLGVASAQTTLGGGSFVGTTQDRRGCPAVTLHIIRSGSTILGSVMYVNGGGMSSIHGQ